MSTTNVKYGLRQSLLAAKSIAALDELMSKSSSYTEASDKTKRAWRSTYKRAAKKLQPEVSK